MFGTYSWFRFLVKLLLHTFWTNGLFLSGTSLHLLEATVSNAVADLNDDGEINMTMINTNSSQLTNESSSKVYSKKRKQEPQMQNSTISGSEKVAISPRKRKGSSIPIASKGVAPESTGDVTLSTPHSVKIAALETLEVLLNVVCLNPTYFSLSSYFSMSFVFCLPDIPYLNLVLIFFWIQL
jgi:hypothetical protein